LSRMHHSLLPSYGGIDAQACRLPHGYGAVNAENSPQLCLEQAVRAEPL
jgi:hypothetical protein